MKNELVYLASPYSHPDPAIREQRFIEVSKIAAKLMADGLLIFCPIAHTHPIAVHGNLHVGWEFWRKYDIAMLEVCSRLIVVKMEGWRESVGVRAEIEIMTELGRPIEYLDFDRELK